MPEQDRTTLAEADFEDLLREVLARVNGALDEQARLRLLLDAVVTMAADLTLDGVLARIVEISRHLTGAQYAALGVLNSGPRKGLRTFVHHGMTPVQVEEIGELPTGHGILGLLIDRPEPLRLHDISAHPESYGFPPHHPPMSSFLGVPVRIRDQVFGNLYLTEKPGGDFTPEDEEIVVALAAAAGVAIENARLYEEAGRREEWLEATAEISGLLSGSGVVEDALQVVADRARQVSGADVAWLATGTPDDVELRALSGPAVTLADMRDLSMDKSLSREVMVTGEPISSDDMTQDRRAMTMDHIAGWPTIGPAIVVPLRAASEVVGALALGWTPEHSYEYHRVDPRLPASFAEQAALALQLVRSRENERRLALFEDRDRIGRDLHDLVIQRLFAVGLSLQSISRVSDVPQVNERIEAAVDDLDATIKDIRRSIFALGSSEAAADIQTEITHLVERAASTLKFRPTLEIDGPVRSTVSEEVAPHLLAVLGETLSNAIRHSGATTIDVRVRAGDRLDLTVCDNGGGLPGDVHESGLKNVRDRATRLGGTCEVVSSPDGTTVTWSVPFG
ncbi:GAF domain-containing protein [Marmoricola sp. URHB0036]|uniref:sensor histidine kinase n=1 Tax=Marmoricola sp. URHB0036 TaxID=1298863 RepID=UPI0003FDD050|nr:GAF domain-containing protein [Marmoricola sp. URHB0036]